MRRVASCLLVLVIVIAMTLLKPPPRKRSTKTLYQARPTTRIFCHVKGAMASIALEDPILFGCSGHLTGGGFGMGKKFTT